MNTMSKIKTAAATLVRRTLWALRHPKLAALLARATVEAHWAVARRKLLHPGCEGAMNVLSWPPVEGTATGYDEVAGQTTVRWGTDALWQSAPGSGAGFFIVTSFKQSPDQDPEYLTNGSGIKAGLIMLTHGYKWECTVRDDTRMTSIPRAGATVNILDAGNIVLPAHRSDASTAITAYTARVVNPDYTAAPKQPGERVLLLEALLLIDGTSGKLVPAATV